MTSSGTPAPAPPASALARGGAGRAFSSILHRDLFVTNAELPAFIAQAIIQPVFMAFVFGKVLTDLGFARPGFAQLLLPGLVALTVMLTGLQSTALPLVIEFSFTKEIEDRLLAPPLASPGSCAARSTDIAIAQQIARANDPVSRRTGGTHDDRHSSGLQHADGDRQPDGEGLRDPDRRQCDPGHRPPPDQDQ